MSADFWARASLAHRLRWLRFLDVIAACIAAAAVLFCHPQLGTTPLGELGNRHMLPVFAAAAAALALPWLTWAGGGMAAVMLRLRTAALLAAGLGPFVSWWLRAEDNLYLAAAAAAGIGAGLWFLHELGALLVELFRCRGAGRLARASRLAQVAVFYGLLVPSMGVYVCFAVALAVFPGTIVADLHRAWTLLPTPVRLLMVLVVLNLAWLTWCAHGVLAAGMGVGASEEVAEE